jgi:hypothetical protein
MDQDKEFWAIVGLFGHQKIAGKISEQQFGAPMVRIDIPETEAAPAFTRLVNPSAVYDINPVTEEVARAYAERLNVKPIEAWDAREVLRRIDEAKKLQAVSEPSLNLEEEDDDDRYEKPRPI